MPETRFKIGDPVEVEFFEAPPFDYHAGIDSAVVAIADRRYYRPATVVRVAPYLAVAYADFTRECFRCGDLQVRAAQRG